MGCYKLDIILRENTPLKVVYRRVDTEPKVVQMWYQVDPKAELGYNMSPYCSMGNNPISYTDPEGDWIHIAIGAAIGGIINVATHWDDVKRNPWNALGAFAIGAAAGAVTAATGGAAAGALGLGTTGVASGLVTGGVGAIAGAPIQGFGNALAFKDPYSWNQYGTDILMGAAIGGVVSGGIAAYKGQNIWWGNTVRPVAPSLPRGPGNKNGYNKFKGGQKGVIEVGDLRIATDPKSVSEYLESFDIYGRTNNTIYSSQVEEYVKQMYTGTYKPSGAGGFTDGTKFLLTEGHHRAIASSIYAMNTGNTSYLAALINQGRFLPTSAINSYGYSLSQFSIFSIKWK